MKNKTLVMLVGLPRSGKSESVRHLGIPIVSPDAIRISLHGRRFYAETESFVWALARVMVAALFRAGHDRVALDSCNHTRKRRSEWKSDLWSRSYIVKHTDPETCMSVARREKDDEIMPVIARMAAEYEPVQADEWDQSDEH
jgi:tRNA uridine 5-carbamoylmethylation protein Kti12